MISTLVFMLMTADTPAATPAPAVEAPAAATQAPAQPNVQVNVEKQIIYQKEQTVDLTGSKVDGDNQTPPAFFLTKMQTPNARSLLEERLHFKLRDYNLMGF